MRRGGRSTDRMKVRPMSCRHLDMFMRMTLERNEMKWGWKQAGLALHLLYTCSMRFFTLSCGSSLSSLGWPPRDAVPLPAIAWIVFKSLSSHYVTLHHRYEEEYPVEDVEVTTADYMGRVQVLDFRLAWEKLGEETEVLERFRLSTFDTTAKAVAAVTEFLAMQVGCRTQDARGSIATRRELGVSLAANCLSAGWF